MRIVGVFEHLAAALTDRTHLLGGAEITALTHLRALADDHDCHILTPSSILDSVIPAKAGSHPADGKTLKRLDSRLRGNDGTDGPYPASGKAHVAIATYRDLEELKQLLARLRPEIVLSNLNLVYAAANLAGSMGIPHVALLDSFECCEPDESEKRLWGVSRERVYLSADRVAFALRASARVLACSNALARRVRRRHRVGVETLYPTFDPDALMLSPSVARSSTLVTGICGFAHKGARMFLELSRRFPRERFRLAGHVDPALRTLFARRPNVTLAGAVPTRELLAGSRIVVVPSQWEEPFGRIAVEAMANGIPVLASWTGGLKEIVGRSALGVRDFRSADAWTAALRPLIRSETAGAANGAVGRRLAQRFVSHESAAKLDDTLRAVQRARAPQPRARTIAIVGSDSAKTAFALINERLAAALEKSRVLHILRCSGANQTGIGAVDCFVQHDYTADFTALAPPEQGRWVIIRPWDFGRYPAAWATKIRDQCDQLWVASRWSKTLAVRSGIPTQRVAVVPWGVDTTVFRPSGTRYAIPTRKRFVFLFVGAAVYRKGLDILLDAYGQAFKRQDDVCLIIKTNPRDVFYGGIGMRERIEALQAQASQPQIVLIDDFLGAARLASLYRACDVGVFPYRAEGFSLPILEGMACGLPSIVPDFGACLDYCSRPASFRVPVRRIHLPLRGTFQFNTLGFKEDVDEIDFCEMPVEALALEMRRVAQLSAAVMQHKAAAAVRVSHTRFTWAHTAARAGRALEVLCRQRVPYRFALARRQRDVAVELLAMRGP